MFTTSVPDHCTKCNATVCDCTKRIFSLFSSLTDTNAAALQIKLNNYVSKNTFFCLFRCICVFYVFMVMVLNLEGVKDLLGSCWLRGDQQKLTVGKHRSNKS